MSDEEYAYSDEDYAYREETDDETVDNDKDDNGCCTIKTFLGRTERYPSFTIHPENEILANQKEAVAEVAVLLGLSSHEAGVLLRHFKWDKERCVERWWSEGESLRVKLGLPTEKSSAESWLMTSTEIPCIRCNRLPEGSKQSAVLSPLHISMFVSETTAMSCGHFFCAGCWRGLIEQAIDAGASCLSCTCPALDCKLVLPEPLVERFCADKLPRYRRVLLESFVVQSNSASYCPAPGCTNVVEYPKRDKTRIISCNCGAHWCCK